MDVTTAKAWESLSKFENYDYVWNLIQNFDPKTENFPDDKKLNHIIRDINAHFTQGREYFRNAEQAALITKPLLFYYGVLALARGSISLLNADNANFTRAFGHGLCLQDSNLMQEENATKNKEAVQNEDSIPNLLDIGVKRAKKSDKKNQEKKSGTFEEFVDCIGNSNKFFVEIDPRLLTGQMVLPNEIGRTKTCYLAPDLPKTNFFTKNNCLITLDDLLSRDSRLFLIYHATLHNKQKRSLKYLLADLTTSRGGHEHSLEVTYYLAQCPDNTEFLKENTTTSLGKLCPQSIRYLSEMELYYFNVLLKNKSSKIFIRNNSFEGEPYFEEEPSSLPAIQALNNDFYPKVGNLHDQEYKEFAILNFNDGDSFSLLHITYMTAYILGMVARYHPYQWTSLLRGEKGNPGQPIILQAIQNIERDFPVLIDSALDSKLSKKLNKELPILNFI